MVTRLEIEDYYKAHHSYITHYLFCAGAKDKAPDITNEVFLSVIKARKNIKILPSYVWRTINNKLKNLYKSSDHKATKIAYIDGFHDYFTPDEKTLCDGIDKG